MRLHCIYGWPYIRNGESVSKLLGLYMGAYIPGAYIRGAYIVDFVLEILHVIEI